MIDIHAIIVLLLACVGWLHDQRQSAATERSSFGHPCRKVVIECGDLAP